MPSAIRKSKAKYLSSNKAARKVIAEKGKKRVPPETRRTYQKGVRHGGRAKGTPNKFPGLLKEALIEAAEYAGRRLPPISKRGEAVSDLVNYLAHQAIRNPQSFLPLLGRVLPLQIVNDGNPLIQITNIEVEFVEPDPEAQRGRFNGADGPGPVLVGSYSSAPEGEAGQGVRSPLATEAVQGVEGRKRQREVARQG